MTSQEFKIWFEGYLEGTNGPLTAEQIEVVKGKLRTVEDEVTYPVPFWVYRPPEVTPRPRRLRWPESRITWDQTNESGGLSLTS